MSFAIVTDSLAGLPLAQVARLGLVVIPLSYSINGQEHLCLAPEGYDSAAFFHAMKQRAEVSTSMIPPQRFVEYLQPLLQSGLDVLFISTSSGISSSYQSSCIAGCAWWTPCPPPWVKGCWSCGPSPCGRRG